MTQSLLPFGIMGYIGGEIMYQDRCGGKINEYGFKAGCCGDSDSIPCGDNVDDVGAELDCYECGYGDDYYFDDDGDLVSACSTCQFNDMSYDDDDKRYSGLLEE